MRLMHHVAVGLPNVASFLGGRQPLTGRTGEVGATTAPEPRSQPKTIVALPIVAE